jgi:hypothetical protein
MPVNEHFFYDNMELQIVDSYVYLGMLLHYNGKFLQTEKRLSQQGARALSSQTCNQYFKILKGLEIYIGKWPSSPSKKAVGTFLLIFKSNLQKRLCITSIS